MVIMIVNLQVLNKGGGSYIEEDGHQPKLYDCPHTQNGAAKGQFGMVSQLDKNADCVGTKH